MDPSDFPPGKFPRKELQGPRPTPLKIHKDSHKIRKPPVAPQASQPPPQPPRQPVIIYDISPKIIHTHPSNFMDLVQRLTGLPPSSSSSSLSSSTNYGTTATITTTAASTANPNFYDNHVGDGAISPAARYATIEKAKSPQRMTSVGNIDHHVSGWEGMEVDSQYRQGAMDIMNNNNNNNNKGLFSGILSPGPASLPRISPNFFSPLSDSFFHDLSPVLNGNKNFIEGSFMPSPAANSSYFVSPRMTSPSTPSIDFLFNNIFSDNN